jgi:phosphohistidine phosphatase
MKKNKVLHIVRHAKSSWDSDGIADIDRTLKPKGIRNAYETARKIKLINNLPDMIVSSPADRALHTAIIFARVFEYPLGKLLINDVLYEFSKDHILDFVRDFDNSKSSLMIFGHNPDVTNLVNYFLKKSITEIPTSGVTTLMFSCDTWKNIAPENMEKHLFYFPSNEE